MSERVEEARRTLMEAVDLDTTDCPHCVNVIAALDAYILAVRADERARLRGVVAEFVERENPDCDYDRQGFCQEHYSHRPCIVERANAFLAALSPEAG